MHGMQTSANGGIPLELAKGDRDVIITKLKRIQNTGMKCAPCAQGYCVCVCECVWNIDIQYGPAQMHAFHLHRSQFYMHSLMMSMLIWFAFSASENNEYWKGSNKTKILLYYFAVYAILMHVCTFRHSKSARKTNRTSKKKTTACHTSVCLYAICSYAASPCSVFLRYEHGVHPFSSHCVSNSECGCVLCTCLTLYKYQMKNL